jgi:hypothetical protein
MRFRILESFHVEQKDGEALIRDHFQPAARRDPQKDLPLSALDLLAGIVTPPVSVRTSPSCSQDARSARDHGGRGSLVAHA